MHCCEDYQFSCFYTLEYIKCTQVSEDQTLNFFCAKSCHFNLYTVIGCALFWAYAQNRG